MLLEIADFLQKHPKEVVVLELIHVYDAHPEQLDVLRKAVQEVLGAWLDDACRCADCESVW
jgi:hypothetical protein